MEYEERRAAWRGVGMAGTCGIFITAAVAAEAMANVTFVAAAARGREAAAAAGNKANVSCKYFIATM